MPFVEKISPGRHVQRFVLCTEIHGAVGGGRRGGQRGAACGVLRASGATGRRRRRAVPRAAVGNVEVEGELLPLRRPEAAAVAPGDGVRVGRAGMRGLRPGVPRSRRGGVRSGRDGVDAAAADASRVVAQEERVPREVLLEAVRREEATAAVGASQRCTVLAQHYEKKEEGKNKLASSIWNAESRNRRRE
jgi:hypothetical protein